MMPGVLSRYIARRFAVTIALILASVGSVILLFSFVDVLRRFSHEYGFNAMLGLRLAAMHVPLLLDMTLPFAFLFGAVPQPAQPVAQAGARRSPREWRLRMGVPAGAVPGRAHLRRARNRPAQPAWRSNWRNAYHRPRLNFRARSRRSKGTGSVRREAAHPSIVYAGSASVDNLTLFGVTAFVFDEAGKFKEKVTAPSATYDHNRWILSEAIATSSSRAPHDVARYELSTDLSTDELKRSFAEPEAISAWALPDFIATAQRRGLNPDRFRVEFHELINRPVFLLAMVMIAATVSLRLTRYGGTWRHLLTGAAIGFLLYALAEIASDLGGNGIISPVLAAWLPPLVALTFGATALLFQEDG